jgi:subtilisin family serine protease
MANRLDSSPGSRSLRAILLVGAGTMVAAQVASSKAAARDPRGKIEPAVLESVTGGEATFWVLLRERANLAPAHGMKNEDARGAFVFRKLREAALHSQADLRALLDGQGARYQSFWIVNALRVTGAEDLLLEIAARPEVRAILADRALRIPPPQPDRAEARIDTLEWGIETIRAHRVWSRFNVRGENIVVANIDTGVQYNHTALVRQYRGNLGGGNFDHNYNWFDPASACNPSNVPCDNVNHGTHTMGTMVGDDGQPGPNQIGVAPNAKWITAKGCESVSCSLDALVASGEWMLAPTDLNGNNPQPSKRPHVVNNSWGGQGGNPFYADIVDAWVASGIFPVFSNGSSGPSCMTSGSPGDYVASYSAGAFSRSLAIAAFSSRGPSVFGPGEIKPNLAAPGVSVRSSVPVNSYAVFSGTSMAQPHVAGTVALMWSRSTTIRRDIAATRLILDNTAKGVSNLSCGGTADDNNVWGEGRLDAFGATAESPLP